MVTKLVSIFLLEEIFLKIGTKQVKIDFST